MYVCSSRRFAMALVEMIFTAFLRAAFFNVCGVLRLAYNV